MRQQRSSTFYLSGRESGFSPTSGRRTGQETDTNAVTPASEQLAAGGGVWGRPARERLRAIDSSIYPGAGFNHSGPPSQKRTSDLPAGCLQRSTPFLPKIARKVRT